MSIWMAAIIALLPAFMIPLAFACKGSVAARLVAVQLATALTILILVLMTFAFDQSTFIDLPLTLAFLTIPSALLMALFVERWL